jgi:hypothetical protein
MWKKKTIGAALACALAMGAWSGSALATPVYVGGVWVDPDSVLDLSIQALNFRESSVSQVGDVLTGYGVIGAINGNFTQAQFCPGCNLNFTFSYRVADIDTSGTNPLIVFDSGSVNFYVDNTSSFNVLDPTTAGIGSLWLSLDGHTAPRTGFSALGQLYSSVNGTPANPMGGSFGFGLLDVTGGAAAYFADTNTIADSLGGFADFSLNSSFQYDGAPICGNNTCYPISGQGGLLGKSLTVPEPGTIGLLGLGLGFLGLALRRRRKESDDVA